MGGAKGLRDQECALHAAGSEVLVALSTTAAADDQTRDLQQSDGIHRATSAGEDCRSSN